MTYQVLARKWRPKAFVQLVGQAHVVTAIVNALDTGRLHHAYLFTGTRGVGKTTLARLLAKSINCEGGVTSQPCGSCRSCSEIDAGRFVDLLEVDAATNTKVDEMRDLLDTAQYMPVSGRFKVYIIDEVHMLSRHAFNSMLKTLEEPPEHVKFILATTDPHRLPVTVLSRCLQFNLKSLSSQALAQHLRTVLEAERIPFDEAALLMLGRAAGGSVRDSLSLTDQAIAFGSGRVLSPHVAEMLGTVGDDLVWPLMEKIVSGNGPIALQEVDRITERGLSCDQALQDMAVICHRIALCHAGVQPHDDDPDFGRVTGLAKQLTAERNQVMYQVLILGRRDLALSPSEAAGLGMTVMRLLSFGSENLPMTGPLGTVAFPSATPTSTGFRPTMAGSVSASSTTEGSADGQPHFDGSWPAFVERHNFQGLAGLLARYSELVAFNGSFMHLVLPEHHKMYAEPIYQEKLQADLTRYFGLNFQLKVSVGATTGDSVAAVRAAVYQKDIEVATEALEGDPFVRELIDDMGARIVNSSIRRVDEWENEKVEHRRSRQ